MKVPWKTGGNAPPWTPILSARSRHGLALLLLLVCGWAGLASSVAHAFQAERRSESKEPAKAAASDAPQGSAESEDSGSIFEWMVKGSGPIGVVILLLSVYLIALVIWMALEYRRKVALPALLTRELTDLLSQRRYNDAYQRVATDSSFLARVVAAGARKLPMGRDAALHAADLANEDVTMEMEHRTTYLAVVGTLGPMIGLVGTVYGMIISFRVMAYEGGSPRASQLAQGISTALFATLEGIALSIPAIYFHALFRNRIARLSLEAAIAAESFLDQFAPGAKPSAAMGGLALGLQRTGHPQPTGGATLHVHPGGFTGEPRDRGDAAERDESDPGLAHS